MVKNERLPRVLIYGETFKKSGGGGITLYTLFGDWPFENISMLSDRFGEVSDIHFTEYYQLGHLEIRTMAHKFGLKTGNTSGAITISQNKTLQTLQTQDTSISTNSIYFQFKRAFISLVRFFGIQNLFFQVNTSKELIEWISIVKPDVIYFQPNTIQSISLLNEIHEQTGIPYIIHVMDNFLDTNILGKKLNFKEKKALELSIKKLVSRADLCIGICDEMAKYYSAKFQKDFFSYQHAVNTDFWFKNYNVRINPSKFIILYAGRISLGTKNSLISLAKAIENCNEQYNCNFDFQIQTTSDAPKILRKLSQYKCVSIHPAVEYNTLPNRFAQADLLVLPMDFDEESLQYIRYSMPTKVPEYLATGVPILVLAHETTALYKYAKSQNWAFTCSSYNTTEIGNLLKDIKNNNQNRIAISETAKFIGKQNHDINVIRRSFKQRISDSLMNKL